MVQTLWRVRRKPIATLAEALATCELQLQEKDKALDWYARQLNRGASVPAPAPVVVKPFMLPTLRECSLSFHARMDADRTNDLYAKRGILHEMTDREELAYIACAENLFKGSAEEREAQALAIVRDPTLSVKQIRAQFIQMQAKKPETFATSKQVDTEITAILEHRKRKTDLPLEDLQAMRDKLKAEEYAREARKASGLSKRAVVFEEEEEEEKSPRAAKDLED